LTDRCARRQTQKTECGRTDEYLYAHCTDEKIQYSASPCRYGLQIQSWCRIE
jgi:hypothetical protein